MNEYQIDNILDIPGVTPSIVIEEIPIQEIPGIEQLVVIEEIPIQEIPGIEQPVVIIKENNDKKYIELLKALSLLYFISSVIQIITNFSNYEHIKNNNCIDKDKQFFVTYLLTFGIYSIISFIFWFNITMFNRVGLMINFLDLYGKKIYFINIIVDIIIFILNTTFIICINIYTYNKMNECGFGEIITYCYATFVVRCMYIGALCLKFIKL